MHYHFRWISRSLFSLLLVTFLCTSVRAQIRISRQVIATAVWSSTPEGSSQRLKMTATAGEVFVGTKKGDIRATVGFQQPDDDVLVSIVTLGSREVTVRAYPNPAIDQLYVDLTETGGAITDLQLLDLLGRVLIRRQVTTDLMELPEISRLAGGTYFLRGSDRVGKSYALGTVLITPH